MINLKAEYWEAKAKRLQGELDRLLAHIDKMKCVCPNGSCEYFDDSNENWCWVCKAKGTNGFVNFEREY